MGALHWDLFCHVVDNFGDVGVCWRLAAQLGGRGDRVRLVIDDPSALAWMAPRGAPGVDLASWSDVLTPRAADVSVEAFGCRLPPSYVAALARARPAPVWINLEYLSAEDYVERSHALPSPQPDGLVKWFYFPGFTPRTGGLLREDHLLAERTRFERDRWLASIGATRRAGERVVSLFCYPNPVLSDLLRDLAAEPTLLLLTPGAAQEGFDRLRASAAPPATLRWQHLPWLDHADYDRLLWSADLNFVRGEDSLVRAIWAGIPFVWMPYPQHDGVHRAKLEALLARLERFAPPPEVAELALAWNGFASWPGLPSAEPFRRWRAALERWRAALLEQDDLASRLRRFVLARRAQRPGGAATGGPDDGTFEPGVN